MRQKLYSTYHWIITLILLLNMWCFPTIYIGVWIEDLYGLGKTFWISIFLVFFYSIGYAITRLVWKLRHVFSISKLCSIVVTILFGIILFTLIFGWIELQEAMETENLRDCYGDSYSTFLESFDCMHAYLILFSGIAIAVSSGLNYLMLDNLFKKEKRNVTLDAPNKLFMYYLSRVLIIMFIFWILLVFFFPSAGGGGGGGGSGGAGGGGGDGGTKSRKKERSVLVDLGWKRYIKT